MSVSQPSLTVQTVAAAKSRAWLEPLLGLSTGVLGGAIQSKILSAPMSHSILFGEIFVSALFANLNQMTTFENEVREVVTFRGVFRDEQHNVRFPPIGRLDYSFVSPLLSKKVTSRSCRRAMRAR